MTKSQLTSQDIACLTELAAILMPATAELPAPSMLPTYGALLQTAFAASGFTADELRTALSALPKTPDLDTLKAFSKADPVAFEVLALLTSGAYVMAPEVLDALGFPEDRRNPAGTMEAADEYDTGILEPVINRGSCFRDPRQAG